MYSFLSAQNNLLIFRKELLRREAFGLIGGDGEVRWVENQSAELLVKVGTKCVFRFLAQAFVHLLVHSGFIGIILKSKRNGELRHISGTGHHLHLRWD